MYAYNYMRKKLLCFSQSMKAMSFFERSVANPTAGIIIIGDEILNGKTQDVNIHFLTNRLHNLGVRVKKVSVIPDDVKAISEEVNSFSKTYSFVITTGGIGPTHDDVTFEGVADAFGVKLSHNPVIVKLVQQWFHTDDPNSPAMKLALIPETATLNFGEDKIKGIKSIYPVVSVENVTIFPGIPHLITRSFDMLAKTLFHWEGASKFCSREIYLAGDEVSIAPVLNKAVSDFPTVNFGSYPQLFHSYYRTKITMESIDEGHLQESYDFLLKNLNKDDIVDYKNDTLTNPTPFIEELIQSDPNLEPFVKEAEGIIEECFNKYKPEEVCLCFNGGKDCLVVLHLTHTIMLKNNIKKPLQAIYITEPNSFPQVKKFVEESINRYDLDLDILPGPMKSALSTFLVNRKTIKAVIMGTRRVDPCGDSLHFFSPTDGDWPSVMRVNPIINWEYNHVWNLIRGLFLPYCSLYDKGYTSLGSQDNTVPNPSLQTTDRLGRVSFLPAYCLKDNHLERKGRIKGLL